MLHRTFHIVVSCAMAATLSARANTGSRDAATDVASDAPTEEFRLLSDEEAAPYIAEAIEECLADGRGACEWQDDMRFAVGDRGSVVTVACGGSDVVGTDGVATELPYWECPAHTE